MSNDSQPAEDAQKCMTDDSCTVEFTEIVPLDDVHTSEFIDPVVEVEPEDLQEMKQEPADENDIGDSHEYEVVSSCFSLHVNIYVNQQPSTYTIDILP